MEGKSLVGDSLQIVGLNHLTGLVLDSHLSAVEVRNDEVDSAKGLLQSDFVFD